MASRVPMREVPDALLARGVQTASTEEIADLTGLDPHAVHTGMGRLHSAGKVFSPAKGLYVIIPPQYRSWGAVPALDFIDPLMHTLGRQYYVAMLSAAELHGASHQRPQVFQVVVDRHVADRAFGRVRLRFMVNSKVPSLETVRRNSASGSVRVASVEVTALDLASRPGDGGGLSNVATVIGELAHGVGIDSDRIVAQARRYPTSSLRRLGWLLEHVDAPVDLTRLEVALGDDGAARPVVLLDPTGPRVGPSNRRWGIVENTEVETDL